MIVLRYYRSESYVLFRKFVTFYQFLMCSFYQHEAIFNLLLRWNSFIGLYFMHFALTEKLP